MGKVILCSGKKAVRPYIFKASGVKVFTIEELCYCLRSQLDMLDENMIDREMALFIRDELDLAERGTLLEQLVLTRSDLKSRLVVIFCSCNYYDENEIHEICHELEEISSMSAAGRRKRRADRYMTEGRYSDALHEYRSLVGSADGSQLQQNDYGNVLHNIAVIDIRNGRFDAAATGFLEAYSHNGSQESLKAYFFALKLGHNETAYVNEAMRLLDNGEQLNGLEEEMKRMNEKAETAGEFSQIDRLKVLYQQGRTSEFDRLADEMITELKRSYRAAVEEMR